MFNQLLLDAGLDLKQVRLLRHASIVGRSVHEMWREDRKAFVLYQSVQSIRRRPDFGNASVWASFGSTIDGDTVFLGVYQVVFKGVGKKNIPKHHTTGVYSAGSYHWYNSTESTVLQDLAGKLYVAWGSGTRSWIQRADKQNKPVIEVRKTLQDPAFPGHLNFIRPLSQIEGIPMGWKDALRSSKGVYLLTCPKTREQYVGKADGENGFLGRWLSYVVNGHGGNVELRTREASDYQISILEVAGSAATCGEILEMEARWKRKLQSREMGLNKN